QRIPPPRGPRLQRRRSRTNPLHRKNTNPRENIRTMTAPATRKSFHSDRTAQFTESVIREMTRLAIRHGAVNLAQGFPDFPAPVDLKKAAIEAIEADHNQYSITWGTKAFRDAIACKYARTYNLELDPE